MLYWISFCGDSGFLGVAIVEGRSMIGAVEESNRRGINPGGEVAVFEIPSLEYQNQARPYCNRLLQREELARIFGPLSTGAAVTNDMLEAAGPERSAIVCQKCNESNCRCAS
jgi:hypothetical protein